MTATTLAPGVHVDVADHGLPRVVLWDTDDVCWGLALTRRKGPPAMAVYRVIGPVDDDEAWMDGAAAVPPAPQPAAVLTPPPPPRPPAPPTTGDGDRGPVEQVRAVFGDIEVVYDPGELFRLISRLLDAQRSRDRAAPDAPAVVDEPEWRCLAERAGDRSAVPADVVKAARAVVGWCRRQDPERLGLGGWKSLVAQLDGFERVDPPPVTRLVPHPDNVHPPNH